MEKRIQKIIFSLFIFLNFSFAFFAQTPSFAELIRIPLWASLDAYPENSEANTSKDNIFSYPVSQLKKTAPFLISGMVYGWDFVYVPSDKARGVEEYFEIKEIQDFDIYKSQIKYTLPELDETRLYVWCEFQKNKHQIQNYQHWNSIQHPVIHGQGYGNISDGFDGFTDAAKDALKNAVREHYRKIIKNKPKEITGSVLIKNEPQTGVISGKYTIKLDFFLEYGRIIEYNCY